MTDQELFLALGQVREDLVLEAERPRRAALSGWRRTAALAAALAVVAGGSLLAWRGMDRRVPIADYVADQRQHDSGPVGTDAVGVDGIGIGTSVDGSDYSGADAPARPIYSTGDVTIGELSDPGAFPQEAACLAWVEPEELFAEADAVFRGTVRNVQYYSVNVGGSDFCFSRFAVEVTDCLRGDLAPGDIYNVMCPAGTSITGQADSLQSGAQAVFLAGFADADAWLESGGSRFYYADLTELYLTEGIRTLFLQGEDGVLYEKDCHRIVPADGNAVTMDDVWAYCAEMAGAEPEAGFVPPEANARLPEA